MHRLLLTASSLICALAISGCTSAGRTRSQPPSCPQLPPPPSSLMQEPRTEQRVRAELFEPQPSATPRSEGSKPSSEQTEPR